MAKRNETQTAQAVPAEEPQAEPQAAQAEPATGTAAPKKERKAEHEYINAAGEVVENIEDATGIVYRDKATGEVFTHQFGNGEAGDPLTMFAVFGAKTRAINAGSGARQARAKATAAELATMPSDVAYMTQVFGECKTGQWAAPADGTARGPKYDLDVLAQVLVAEMQRIGKNPDLAVARKRLGEDLAFRRGVVQVPEVLAAYTAAMGKTAPTLAGIEL